MSSISHRKWFVIRKVISAGVWLVLPSLTLLVFGSSACQAYFRARPFNLSYDAMFIAATAGIGLTPIWILFSPYRERRHGTNRSLGTSYTWRNAFDLFELFASASLGVLNFVAGVSGSGMLWLAAFLLLLGGTLRISQAEKDVTLAKSSHRTLLSRMASVYLLIVAILFIVFPVLQPWSGPPEPFVRWHPFSPSGELIWRGVFLSFAFGMILTAFDPFGKHRSFLVMLVFSGFLHSGEMAIDNLLSMRNSGMNANPEHLYGDVLGWFVIASVSVSFLFLARRSPRAVHVDGE